MVKATVEWFDETAVKQEVEHGFVLQADGTVPHAAGTVDSVSVEGAVLDGATVVHNHPTEFGAPTPSDGNDFELQPANPGTRFFVSFTGEYEYEATQRIAEVS